MAAPAPKFIIQAPGAPWVVQKLFHHLYSLNAFEFVRYFLLQYCTKRKTKNTYEKPIQMVEGFLHTPKGPLGPNIPKT